MTYLPTGFKYWRLNFDLQCWWQPLLNTKFNGCIFLKSRINISLTCHFHCKLHFHIFTFWTMKFVLTNLRLYVTFRWMQNWRFHPQGYCKQSYPKTMNEQQTTLFFIYFVKGHLFIKILFMRNVYVLILLDSVHKI